MEKVFVWLRPFVRFLVAHPAVVFALGLVLAGLGAWQAANLRVDSDFSKLIPQHYTSVQALERLRAAVGGESEAAVVIESPSFEANRRFAEAFIPRALALRGEGYAEPYFTHVDYRKDTSFLRANALYFATEAELDSLESYLDAQIEEARLDANPFFFDIEDEFEDELEDEAADSAATDASAEALRLAYDRLVGKEYPISDDSTTLVLRFYPSGKQTDVDFIEDAYTDLQRLADEMQPRSYDAGMEITLAGRLLRQLIEVRAITDDVAGSFGAGVLTVLLMVVAYFFYKSYHARAGWRLRPRVLASELARTPVVALVIGVPLMASLAWTFGLAYIVFETLNLMTATLGLVLFGMGIDYGIHFYARYAEERGRGLDVAGAVEETFHSTGQAIAVTAATTAAAFFLFMIADFRGFSEFGFIAGTGILFALVAMTVLMPALLVLFERLRLLDLTALHRYEAPAAGRSRARVPLARTVVVLSAVGVLASVVVLPRVQFEYDFGALDPVYHEYQALQDKVRRVYDDSGRRNPAYVVVDDPAEVPAVEAALRVYAAADTLTPTIGDVETLQSRYPATPEAQAARLARLAALRDKLDDPFLRQAASADLAKLREAASTTAPITMDEVPEFLKAQFRSKDGQLGRLLVIYPSVGLSDGRKSMAFSEDVGTIVTASGETYHAGSTALVAADMLRLMRKEAPLMVGFTILLIIVFKSLVLRSARWVFLAMLPLLAGFLGMFGLMAAFGVKLNFYNLVVLPAVLGIGDDAGIHLVHRYMEEGRGSILRVLRSTGEHISMSALTTMVGFGGLLLSFYPGMRSIGVLAVIGIGMTLVTALFFLPALLQWLEGRDDAPAEDEGVLAGASAA